jgi:hypothetical protein
MYVPTGYSDTCMQLNLSYKSEWNQNWEHHLSSKGRITAYTQIIRDVVYLITGPRTPCQQSLWVRIIKKFPTEAKTKLCFRARCYTWKVKRSISLDLIISTRTKILDELKPTPSCTCKHMKIISIPRNLQPSGGRLYMRNKRVCYKIFLIGYKTVHFIFLPQDNLTFTYQSWRENRNMLQHFWQNHSDAFRIL